MPTPFANDDASSRRTAGVIGIQIDVIDWGAAISRILSWARAGASRYVCICNVHSVVTASQHEEFGRALAGADMATPDGAPVAWLLRRIGHRQQKRINGPDLMLGLTEAAAREHIPICLFGSTAATLELLQTMLTDRFPGLICAAALAPSFHPFTLKESDHYRQLICESGARIVFVSLGCPKQEFWMAASRGAIPAVMIGVGAAFDFHAGTVRRAPPWMRNMGLEWLHRLASEPRRLWRRYLFTNSAFVAKALVQLLNHRRRA